MVGNRDIPLVENAVPPYGSHQGDPPTPLPSGTVLALCLQETNDMMGAQNRMALN